MANSIAAEGQEPQPKPKPRLGINTIGIPV